jgi:hypothetical protein
MLRHCPSQIKSLRTSGIQQIWRELGIKEEEEEQQQQGEEQGEEKEREELTMRSSS